MDLLDLPEEILQCIAKGFTLSEWAKGPALACRLFNRMKLPRVDLRFYKHVRPGCISRYHERLKIFAHIHTTPY